MNGIAHPGEADRRVTRGEVTSLVLTLYAAAVVSVLGGGYLASEPHHSAAWLAGGVVAGVGWWAVAMIVNLLDRIASLLER